LNDVSLSLARAISVLPSLDATQTFHFALLPRRRFPSTFRPRVGLENGRVAAFTMPHSRRFERADKQLFPLFKCGESRVITTTRVYDRCLRKDRAQTFSFVASYRDGCDRLLTATSLTSHGGIRDWIFARVAMKVDADLFFIRLCSPK